AQPGAAARARGPGAIGGRHRADPARRAGDGRPGDPAHARQRGFRRGDRGGADAGSVRGPAHGHGRGDLDLSLALPQAWGVRPAHRLGAVGLSILADIVWTSAMNAGVTAGDWARTENALDNGWRRTPGGPSTGGHKITALAIHAAKKET